MVPDKATTTSARANPIKKATKAATTWDNKNFGCAQECKYINSFEKRKKSQYQSSREFNSSRKIVKYQHTLWTTSLSHNHIDHLPSYRVWLYPCNGTTFYTQLDPETTYKAHRTHSISMRHKRFSCLLQQKRRMLASHNHIKTENAAKGCKMIVLFLNYTRWNLRNRKEKLSQWEITSTKLPRI